MPSAKLLLEEATVLDRPAGRVNRKRESAPKKTEQPRTDPVETIRHSLVMGSPGDLLRHHLAPVTLSAGLIALSGVFTWLISEKLGIEINPAFIVGAYLLLYVVRLSAVYQEARGNFYFVNRRRFYGLLLFGLVTFAPHALAYVVMKAMGGT
jgi:hypothetical protein